jgi:hypothetical protein
LICVGFSQQPTGPILHWQQFFASSMGLLQRKGDGGVALVRFTHFSALKIFFAANAFISPFNTQTIHIKSFYTQQHCYVSL